MITRKLVERRAEIERERLYGIMGDRGADGGRDGIEAKRKGTEEGTSCC